MCAATGLTQSRPSLTLLSFLGSQAHRVGQNPGTLTEPGIYRSKIQKRTAEEAFRLNPPEPEPPGPDRDGRKTNGEAAQGAAPIRRRAEDAKTRRDLREGWARKAWKRGARARTLGRRRGGRGRRRAPGRRTR